MNTFSLTLKTPFSFKKCLQSHGWFQLPPMYWNYETDQLVWVMRFDKNLVAVTVYDEKLDNGLSGKIIFKTDKPLSDHQKEVVRDRFSYVFHLDLDLTEFYNICKNDPVLKVVPSLGLGRLNRCESIYEDVLKAICGTNIQWKQAVKCVHNICQLSEPIKGTDYRPFPSPKQILAVGDQWLKDVGRVGYRSSYIIDLCERVIKNEPATENVESLDYNHLLKYFTSFSGIGPVTAKYLCALHGSFEQLSVDSLVISYMKEKHFNGETPSVKQIENHYEQFGKWAYLAYWMEFVLNEGWSPDE